MKRSAKRGIIIFIYLIIFSLIGFFVYYIITPQSNCFDGKKNQGEKGVDCGGPCTVACEEELIVEEIEVLEKYFVHGRGDNYDLMAKIDNPNNRYGAAKFSYRFDLVDKLGNSLGKREGISFILPGESKYVMELNLNSVESPYSASFEILNIEWEEFIGYEEPKLGIYNKNYHEESGKSEVFGLLKNESYFDFNAIEIYIILRDENGDPVAIGTNEMNTVYSQQERDFRVFWPYNFNSEVKDVEIRAEADVFDPNNSYVKGYRTGNEVRSYGDE
jgi:hypothetical protein